MVDEQEKPKSYVMVVFEEVGSTNLNFMAEGVTPLQLLALANYLELKGKNALIQQENAREEQKVAQQLSVPRDKIIIPSGR